MSLARVVALGAALTLPLTGCGLLDRSPSPSSDGTTATSEGTTETSDARDLGTLTGAGRPMDDAELRDSLPSASEVGSGWEDDPMQTISETQAAQVTPATCAPLLQKGPGWDDVKQSERARVQTTVQREDNPPPPGTERHHLAVWLYSFDTPYPSRLFDEAGALIADCPSFDVKQEDTGNTSAYEASPLTFPQLGDGTVALRLKVQQTLETMTIDFVVIKVGHNTVTVANGAYNGTPDTAITEKAARSAITGLEEQP